MKKFLAIFAAMLLLTVTCMSVVAADPESYLWVKNDDVANYATAPSFQIEFRGDDLNFIEEGKTYTAFATVWFSDDCQGNVYVNYYAYAEDTNGNYDNLNHFQDFASSATGTLGAWTEYSSNAFVPANKTYGTPADGVGVKLMTLGLGFWQAAGEVRLASVGFKDADGNVVFERKFDTVLTSEEGLVNLPEDTKGTAWGIVGETVVEPETPDVETPDTGDATMVFALIAMVSVAGAAVVAKKRG